ncbi:hypothetical protein AEMCBJ_08705 [Cupriavidus necator]
MVAYERFLADPQPAARWMLTGNKKLARSHPDWRPFAGPGSVRQALVILNALCAWLTEAGYLAGNPLALARRRRAPTQARITRYLSHDLWETVKDTVAAMPAETGRERLHAARYRWVLTVLLCPVCACRMQQRLVGVAGSAGGHLRRLRIIGAGFSDRPFLSRGGAHGSLSVSRPVGAPSTTSCELGNGGVAERTEA